MEWYERAGACVVVARGEYDLNTLGPLTAALEKAAEEHRKVVLETSGVRFADSMFLTLLVNVHRRTDLRVAAPTPQLQRVLELTGVDALLPVRETVEDAIAA